MTIQQIIDFLQQLKEEKGDIPISCDFRWHDRERLYYSTECTCVFGE